MKYLITRPYSAIGGVAAFVDAIYPVMAEAEGTQVFYRGAKSGQKHVSKAISQLMCPIRFFLHIIKYRPERIIINTSLSNSLIVRDGLLVCFSKLFNIDTLLIIHGFDERALVHRKVLRFGYYKADAICVLADEFRQHIIKTGFRRKVYTQFNPVSEDILNYESDVLPPVSKTLFIGRIETAKGIYITLDAFRILKDKHPDMTLDVVGIGSEYENVKRYIEEHQIDGAEMHGFKSGAEKLKILANSGTSSSSSYKEGLPISILEAMAVGQLVIARPIGGIVDLYRQCNFGKMIPSLDPKDFVEAYEELISDPVKAEQIRLNNRKFAKEHFSARAIVNNIERFFNEMES